MGKTTVNIQNAKYCAFCKYWWDPTCKYIMPDIGTQWFYESAAKCRCIKKGIDISAFNTCSMFKLKIDF